MNDKLEFAKKIIAQGDRYGKITIELDGVPTDITDLNQEEYEYFLEMMKYLNELYQEELENTEL